jgi:NADPH:quinone reductase-like Zn-dependent oxidoreductase
MRAMILKTQGGIENLQMVELPVPGPGNDEVLIAVKAISINPSETYVRQEKALDWIFKGEKPKILGWDVSGVVMQTGKNVTAFKVGDEVFGMVNHPGHGKAYAEYVAAPASHLALKPVNITHAEAAAASMAALTTWQPLSRVGIKKGDRVLITAAGGGVGHYAIQIAKHLGAYVIALASAAKRDFVLQLGADEHIDYQAQQFEEVIGVVDVVVEALRDEHLQRTLNVVKPGGHLISLFNKVQGTRWESLSKEKGVIAYYNAVTSNGDDMRVIASLLEKGIIRSQISKTFKLEEIPLAHLEIEKNKTQGKIIINL